MVALAADVNDSLEGHVNFDNRNGGWSTPSMRVRIINQSAFASFFVYATDPSFNLEVIEVDGVSLSSPSPVKSVEIHPGQRYSIRVAPLDGAGYPKDVTLVAVIG
jgi:FtsP/CotA-like multicopper oxidase with cupredoxin domain